MFHVGDDALVVFNTMAQRREGCFDGRSDAAVRSGIVEGPSACVVDS